MTGRLPLLLLICVFLVPMTKLDAQILDPVEWSFSSQKAGDNEYTLRFKARIDPGWHVYSQHIDTTADIFPIPTSFHFEEIEGVEFIGDVEETGNFHEENDPMFDGILVKWFDAEAIFSQKVKVDNPEILIKGYLEFMTCDDKQCLPPELVDFDVSVQTTTGTIIGEAPTIQQQDPTDNRFGEPLKSCVEGDVEPKKGLLSIFLLGFLGGLIALVTPCVFPMIPLTVSFFTKKSGSGNKGISNAILFGFCIVLIYFLLSLPFLALDASPDTLNEFATNIWLNLAFFLIFLVFAISFFGYFEITLPSSWTNRADSASDIGGVTGIFFMALTLALVSFSCTGPILGSLLVGSLTSEGGNHNLVAGMTGFGLALAFPFALFAAFPHWLNQLPRSGGWLNTVKVVLGFLELALALKFLSNADLVGHWGLLKREIFIGLWIAIGIGLTLYLLGWIRFPHESRVKKLSFGRASFALLTLAFVIYLIPGMWGTNLKLLSGFPPPMFYTIAEQDTHCPLGLNCFHDYDEGVAYAQENNKPIMIDFTGWACVNCRKMEENVWVEDKIHEKLMDDYVLISLYVDDRQKLPEEDQYESKFSGKMVKTVGNKWSDFQASNFNSNSQPYYVLLSPDQQLLARPVGYTSNVSEYDAYLECGLMAYEESKDIASSE